MNNYAINTATINAARDARNALTTAQASVLSWINPTSAYAEKCLSEARTRLADAEKAVTAAYAPITAAIIEVEGRAKERRLTADQMLDVLDVVDDRIRISNANKVGIIVIADPHAQQFPSSYRYTPVSTQFEAIYTARGWAIRDIARCPVCAPSRAVQVTLPDEAKAAIIKNLENFAL